MSKVCLAEKQVGFFVFQEKRHQKFKSHMVYAISSGCHRTVPIITADFYMRALENIVEIAR